MGNADVSSPAVHKRITVSSSDPVPYYIATEFSRGERKARRYKRYNIKTKENSCDEADDRSEEHRRGGNDEVSVLGDESNEETSVHICLVYRAVHSCFTL